MSPEQEQILITTVEQLDQRVGQVEVRSALQGVRELALIFASH
jgi:hypothetical protein